MMVTDSALTRDGGLTTLQVALKAIGHDFRTEICQRMGFTLDNLNVDVTAMQPAVVGAAATVQAPHMDDRGLSALLCVTEELRVELFSRGKKILVLLTPGEYVLFDDKMVHRGLNVCGQRLHIRLSTKGRTGAAPWSCKPQTKLITDEAVYTSIAEDPLSYIVTRWESHCLDDYHRSTLPPSCGKLTIEGLLRRCNVGVDTDFYDALEMVKSSREKLFPLSTTYWDNEYYNVSPDGGCWIHMVAAVIYFLKEGGPSFPHTSIRKSSIQSSVDYVLPTLRQLADKKGIADIIKHLEMISSTNPGGSLRKELWLTNFDLVDVFDALEVTYFFIARIYSTVLFYDLLVLVSSSYFFPSSLLLLLGELLPFQPAGRQAENVASEACQWEPRWPQNLQGMDPIRGASSNLYWARVRTLFRSSAISARSRSYNGSIPGLEGPGGWC